MDPPQLEVSSDPDRLDRDLVHAFLSREAYWSLGVSREVVERAIEGSIAFGLYEDGAQVGFARVVTDGATFAWVADLFVLSSHRRRGLGRRLVAAMLDHPEVRGARDVVLATADAHPLYERFGFAALAHPERWLSLRRPVREPFSPADRPPPSERSTCSPQAERPSSSSSAPRASRASPCSATGCSSSASS